MTTIKNGWMTWLALIAMFAAAGCAEPVDQPGTVPEEAAEPAEEVEHVEPAEPAEPTIATPAVEAVVPDDEVEPTDDVEPVEPVEPEHPEEEPEDSAEEGVEDEAEGGKMALDIDLPPPLFVGTPVPAGTDIPHLESPRDGPRPPLMVPEGTELLSHEKPVTSSDDWPIIGELEYITDGNKDGDEGYYVELGPGQQWVQIDLEHPGEIHAIYVWHYHQQERVYRDVIVQLSDDPDFEEGVHTVFNNDHDNTSGMGAGSDPAYIETNEGRAIPVDGIEARYVRLYSRGNSANDMNHYIQVSVYGLPRR